MSNKPLSAPSMVDMSIVLAIDESGSVDDVEWALQLEGYRQALQSPRFMKAATSGHFARIAMTCLVWSGMHRQCQTVGWTVIENEQDVRLFAGAMMKSPRVIPDWTSISGAIDYSIKLHAENQHRAARRVIDISGDGINNDGRPVTEARDDAVAAGTTINGLPILAKEGALDAYYRENVIGGPDAFLVVAQDSASFSQAVLQKLITEIAAGPSIGADARG